MKITLPGWKFKTSHQHIWLFSLILFSLLAGCTAPGILQADIKVSVTADGKTSQTSLPSGSTVQDALDESIITLGALDRVEPPVYTVLTNGIVIKVVRVREEFQSEQQTIPFSSQYVHSETLPADRQVMIQQGSNGQEEITYRVVYEDGVQTLRAPIKETILQPAVPEIIMSGIQVSFIPVVITGRIAFLSGGNAWVMEGTTSNRRLLVNTGDLDGWIFSLSEDGNWLLFSRRSTKPADQEINTLWLIDTRKEGATPVDLKISNVVLYAGWVSGQSLTIAYSTVEPRNGSPRWQANNDLYTLSFSASGWKDKPIKIVDSNPGGTYGWWGTTFAWSSDGKQLAYSRPDQIGRVNLQDGHLQPWVKITPLQTHVDWVWVPSIAWGADGNTIFYTRHAPSGSLVTDEESPFFDLAAQSLVNKARVVLTEGSGLFTGPVVSPMMDSPLGGHYQVAFLQAVSPGNSDTSSYHLLVMEQDGSNRRVVFPPEDLAGMKPSLLPIYQPPVWAPSTTRNGNQLIALLYRGDIWVVNSTGTFSQSITGDQTVTRLDWR